MALVWMPSPHGEPPIKTLTVTESISSWRGFRVFTERQAAPVSGRFPPVGEAADVYLAILHLYEVRTLLRGDSFRRRTQQHPRPLPLPRGAARLKDDGGIRNALKVRANLDLPGRSPTMPTTD